MKKKLLLIIPIFPSEKSDDTIVPFIYQFCLYFSSLYDNLQVDIITLRYPHQKHSYTVENITVYPISGGFKGKLNNIVIIYKALIKGIRLFKQNNYDGILSFWYSNAFVTGRILSQLFSKKHYTWMQGQDIKPENKYLKIFKPDPNKLIAIGKNHNTLLMKYQGIQAKRIANVCVDPKTFPKLNLDKRSIDIIGVGNLGALKNYSLFLDVISELKKTTPNINAMICGDGEQKEMLLNKVMDLNLSENVTLLGYVSNKKVRGFLNNSKILLHTSLFEGNSMVVQEALYSGCKVLSTVPLLVDIQNFYFEKDTTKIVQKLKLLINQKSTEPKRIRHFKIEDTADTIYSCFFDSKEQKTS